MKSPSKAGWILSAVGLALMAALTGGTQRHATPAGSPLPPDLPRADVTNGLAPGMHPVRMQDLQEAQLAGVHERVELPDSAGLLGHMRNPAPGGGIAPATPAMQQNRRTERGLMAGGTSAGTSGSSWGWLADDVGAAAPPATVGPESGGFGFSQPSGARLVPQGDDRLGTRQGFGDGGNDAFIFQRRRDERF